jgi:hypothetical protein
VRDRGALDINDLFRKPELAGQDNGDGGVVLGTGLILAVGEGEVTRSGRSAKPGRGWWFSQRNG